MDEINQENLQKLEDVKDTEIEKLQEDLMRAIAAQKKVGVAEEKSLECRCCCCCNCCCKG